MQLILFKFTLFLYAPTEARGLERLEKIKHPVLFFSNHLSAADTPVIYGVLPAKVRTRLAVAAASDVVYESKLPWIKYSKGLLELLFPVFPFARYGQAKSSFEYTGRILDRGFSILLFPEGKVSKTGHLLPFKQGAGLLAIEMGVPIVPIKLQDTQKIIPPGAEAKLPIFHWPKRHKAIVTFGEPFTVDPTLTYREATTFIEKQMRAV